MTGSLWLVDFGSPFPSEPAGHRPALIVGPPNTFGSNFPLVTVAPITTTDRGLWFHVEIEPHAGSGLDEVSYIQCEATRAIARRRLVRHVGIASNAVRFQVSDALRTFLDL